MSTDRKARYAVGKRPPATLTAKAREQLDGAKPSLKVAALAKVAAKLISTSVAGEKMVNIPEIKTLKPGNVKTAITAKDAAGAAQKRSVNSSSRKHIARAK
jgi:hypothetical protein